MTSSLAFVYLPTGVFILLFVAVFIFAMYAQIRVSSAYGKNSRILSRGRITGREAAEAVMAHAGVTDVEVTETSGHLTDHYDPMHKRLVLSSENYRGTSLAALGVAAHEAGHAIQHKVGYSMLKARMALVPRTMEARGLDVCTWCSVRHRGRNLATRVAQVGACSASNPSLSANCTYSARCESPSFSWMRCLYVSTVFGLMNSRSPISGAE